MYEKELQELGLTENQANIYSILILEKDLSAAEILKKINAKNKLECKKDKKIKKPHLLSRSLVYKTLDDLIFMKLVQKKLKNSKTFFSALSPRNLEEKIHMEKIRIEAKEKKFSEIIDALDSSFNISSGKPGVRHLEGVSGSNLVSDDMLNAKDVIYTYLDPTMDIKDQKTKKGNDFYANKRRDLGIKKKIILFNIPEAEKFAKNYHSDITEIKITKTKSKHRVPTIIHIYNNKVVYINFLDHDKISTFIINDKHIYNIQRRLFEENWSILKKL